MKWEILSENWVNWGVSLPEEAIDALLCCLLYTLFSFEKILSQILGIELGEKARESCFLRRQEEGEQGVGISLIGLACYTYQQYIRL